MLPKTGWLPWEICCVCRSGLHPRKLRFPQHLCFSVCPGMSPGFWCLLLVAFQTLGFLITQRALDTGAE